MSFHVDEGKYAAIATQIVESDIAFADFLKTAIESKDLKQTLTLCARKAKQNQGKQGFNDYETAEFAYEIFLVVFNTIPMNPDLKEKMAKTVLEKFRSAVSSSSDSSESPSSPTSYEQTDSISSQIVQQEQNLTPSNSATPKRLTALPSISTLPTAKPLPTIEPVLNSNPISPAEGTETTNELPLTNNLPVVNPPVRPKLFSTAPTPSIPTTPIEVNKNTEETTFTQDTDTQSSELKIIAQKAIIQDSTFEMNLKEAIEAKNLNQTLSQLIEKAQEIQQINQKITEHNISTLAYELCDEIFQDIPINPDQKEKMLKTIKSKLDNTKIKPSQNKQRISEEEEEEKLDLDALVNSVLKENPQFSKDLKSAIELKKLGETLDLLYNQIYQINQLLNSDNPTKLNVADKLFTEVISEIAIPDDIKQKMKNTVLEKLSVKFDSSPPIQTQARPQLFKSVFSSTEQQESEATPSEDASSDEKLRLERENLRKQRLTEKEESKAENAKKLSPNFNPIEKLQQWLKSDNKFIEIITTIKQTSDNAIRINLDPDSEGVIPYIDLTWEASSIGNQNIIKIEASAPSTNKYPINIAIAHNGKRFVATSLDDEKLDDIPAIIKKAREVNFKNQLEWDQLMAILNNDKYLFKNLDKLVLNNPVTGSKDVILVPLVLKQDVPTSRIILSTFLSQNLKPTTIFIDVMEQFAENVDKISGDENITQSFSSRFSSIDGTGMKDYSGYQFRFLEKDRQVSFKTCPHCGHPYPNPDADYRRCPHCLAKLK